MRLPCVRIHTSSTCTSTPKPAITSFLLLRWKSGELRGLLDFHLFCMCYTYHHALNALAKDHEFLLEGGVFTEDLIEKYYDYKKVNEADAVAMRPHPYEFDLYFDA